MTDSKNDATPTAPTAPKKKPEKPDVDATIEENEIRVTAQGKMRNYVAYAATIFSESKSQSVVLKGMGRVINKTVSLAEILKRRVKGLYQLAEIGSIKVVDKKSGKGEEEPTEVVRLLSVIKIVLTTDPEDKAKFQPPIDESMVEPMMTLPKRVRPGRSRNKAKKMEAKETGEASEEKKETNASKAKRIKRKRNRKAKKDAIKDADEATAPPDEAVKADNVKPEPMKDAADVKPEPKKEAVAEEAAVKQSTEASA